MKGYLILFALLLPSVFAQEINSNLYQEVYQPGETLQLEFAVKDLAAEPTTANIKLLNSLNNEVKVAPFLLKIEQNYFIYFDLPDNLEDGSYKVVINKLKIYSEKVLKEVNHEINFNISKKTSIVSINPAILILNKDSKELQVQLNNKGPLVAVELSTSDFINHPYTKSEQLTGLGQRKFYFYADLKNIDYNTKGYINVSYSNESYTIPVFVITSSSEPIHAFEFITELTSLSKTLNKKEELSGSLGIRNRLNEDLKEVYFELTGNLNEIIKLNITYLPLLEAQSIINERFEINKDKNTSGESYIGNFIVKSGQYSSYFPIYIQFLEEQEPPKEVKTTKEQSKEHELFTLPPPTPVSTEPESKLGLYLTILVLLIVAAIIYKLSRKEKQKKSFKEYLSTIKR